MSFKECLSTNMLCKISEVGKELRSNYTHCLLVRLTSSSQVKTGDVGDVRDVDRAAERGGGVEGAIYPRALGSRGSLEVRYSLVFCPLHS